MEVIPAQKTKKMLKCPGSTVEIAALSTEPRNGNLHLQQVSEMPLPDAGHGLRFHLPRHFSPETVGELLLMPQCLDGACLHRRRPAELHVCQRLLASLSTAPQHPRVPPHPSFPHLTPMLGHKPCLRSTGFLSFTSLDLSSPACKLKHPGFSIPGDPQGKSCISTRKPIGR